MVDRTDGHGYYGCAQCCGWRYPTYAPDPFTSFVGDWTWDTLYSTDCTGTEYDITFYGYSWGSTDTGVATVVDGDTNLVGVGSATGSALTDLETTRVLCPIRTYQPAGAICSYRFQISGNPFIFVGSDSHITAANSFFATNGSGNSPQPSGGTVSATSSDSHDTFQITQGSLPVVKVTTPGQSTTNGDRSLTFTYTVIPCNTFPRSMTVTARQFAYVTNNNPSNTCSLGYGTDQTYTYTVYTHPDRTAVDASSGLSGTPVTETFDQTPVCITHTGDGSLNGNGQFTDHLEYCGNTPLTCSETRTQTLGVAGFTVRTNTLQAGSGGITYTNNGPTQ